MLLSLDLWQATHVKCLPLQDDHGHKVGSEPRSGCKLDAAWWKVSLYILVFQGAIFGNTDVDGGYHNQRHVMIGLIFLRENDELMSLGSIFV